MSETNQDIPSPLGSHDTTDFELQPFNSEISRIDVDFPRDHSGSRNSLSLQGLHSQVVRYGWHIICLGLHAMFTLLYLAQIPIMCYGLEKKVQVAVGRETDRISLAIQILLQALAIAYLSAALFVTQKLFMHRLLIVRQPLTSSHDQYSSWLGLGSAAFTLFKQRSATGKLRWLFLIAVYLSASAVVKICTAALFQMTPETIVQTIPMNATAVASDSLTRFMDGITNDTLQAAQSIAQQLSMVLNYNQFGSLNPSGEIGLEGNTLYDLIPLVENATENGLVVVNAYTTHVDCKMLSMNDLLRIAPSNEANPAGMRSYWWRLRALAWINLKKQQDPNQFLIPISTIYPILDSSGRSLNKPPLNQTNLVVEQTVIISKVELNEPQSDPNKAIQDDKIDTSGQLLNCPQGVAYANSPLWADGVTTNTDVWSGSLGTDGMVGLASCRFTWTAGTETVDSVKRTLSQPRKLKTTSSWTEATTDELSVGSKWEDFPGHAAALLMGGNQAPSAGFFRFWCNTTVPYASDSRAATIGIYAMDLFSFKHLGLLGRESPTIMLHDFENMLEEWLALSIWIREYLSLLYEPDANTEGNIKGFASNVVNFPKNVQVSQLTLRAVPVYAGFAASLVMLAVACAIVFTTPVLLSHPNEVGVLQLLWLSDVDLGTKKSPTEANLRKAGLATNISLVHGVGNLRRRG
ncbi:hypothetical protein DL96DRAFT_1761126 [Flagelloscypha sp. PMI_526]|nr:hypothetical protein DL96DRAFT_1761126 [Flagelloscypha sp. PMI_526]